MIPNGLCAIIACKSLNSLSAFQISVFELVLTSIMANEVVEVASPDEDCDDCAPAGSLLLTAIR